VLRRRLTDISRELFNGDRVYSIRINTLVWPMARYREMSYLLFFNNEYLTANAAGQLIIILISYDIVSHNNIVGSF